MWWLLPNPASNFPFLIKAFQGDVGAAWRSALPPPRLRRFVSLHSCRLPDLSQLWLWNVSRDVAALFYSSMNVPARLLAQVKILHHVKIYLLGFSLLSDLLGSQIPLLREIWLAPKSVNFLNSCQTAVISNCLINKCSVSFLSKTKIKQTITNNVLK